MSSDVEESQWPAVEYHQKQHGSGGVGSSVSSAEELEGGATGGQYVEISGVEHQQRTVSPGTSDAQAPPTPPGGSRFGGYASISVHEEKVADLVDLQEKDEKTRLPGCCYRLRLPSKGDMLIYGCFLLNVTTKGTISCFETLGAQYASTRFELTSAQVNIKEACSRAYNHIVSIDGLHRNAKA